MAPPACNCLRTLQDRGYEWKGSKEEENVFQDDAGSYEPDYPETQEVKFKEQKPEENVFEGVEVRKREGGTGEGSGRAEGVGGGGREEGGGGRGGEAGEGKGWKGARDSEERL
jgi:hypothetical protein